MSRTYATPLELELHPSQIQQRWLLLMHLLAVISILILPIGYWLRLLGVGILAGHYFYWRGRDDIGRLVWKHENTWQLTINQINCEANLQPGTLLSPWLILLILKDVSGHKWRIPIWRDSVNPDSFRRLYVRMKIEQGGLWAGSQSEK